MGWLPKKLEVFLLILVIALAVFFRFWQIRDYVVFLGDEGRDMLVMREMILEKRPTFLGPTASAGGFYLGPIYYWMATPFLLLSRFDPVGPSYLVAIFGVATVFLLYQFLKMTVGFWPAILVSSLYSAAPLIVRYSRSSWNPNPLPFFSLLLIYSLYLAIIKKKPLFFLLSGLSFGVAIQLHYLAVMLIPVSLPIIVLNTHKRIWFQAVIYGLAGTIMALSPFLLFEIKHNFPNFKTILEFVTRPSTHGYQTYNFVWLISNIGNIFLEELTRLKGTIVTRIIFWILTIGGAYGLIKNWRTEKKFIFVIGLAWFIGGLAVLRYYSGQLFDYYFGFMFPAPFLLGGLVFYLAWQKKALRIIGIAVTTLLLFGFFLNGFFRIPPNRLIDQTIQVTNFVIEKSQRKPFNFALISDRNSDHAYRYFLEVEGYKPTELETMITDQLLIVCESQKCAPLGHPTWEIAGFGRAEIAGEWELPNIGIRIFKLTHWPGAPNPAGKPAVKGV